MRKSLRLLAKVRRRRAPYALLFGLAIIVLLTGAVSTFRVIGASALRSMAADSAAAAMMSWPGDAHDVSRADAPIVPDRAAYDRFAAEDSAWRARNARVVSVSELRARGDGKRTPRETMQDRVYRFQRSGRRESAVGELERWVGDHPRDEEALLSLARLLRETGRTDEALRRYRDALTLHSGR
jgi:tetratricopeptide (TPR) repeat protein